jgi:hypothetical protein
MPRILPFGAPYGEAMTGKKPSKPRHRYKGLLATPWDDLVGIGPRFTELFKHFGIDRRAPGAETELIFALARRHVPGIAMKKNSLRIKGNDEIHGAGQKPTFTPAESVMAFVDVKKKMEIGLKESEACRELITAERWERIFDGTNLQPEQKAECIRGMYRSYRDAFPNLTKGQANDTQLGSLASVFDVPFNDLEQINEQVKRRTKIKTGA